MAAFFATSGGAVIEKDVPTEGTNAREIHDELVAKGDLVPIDAELVEKVVDADGTYRYQRVETTVDEPAETVEDEPGDEPEPVELTPIDTSDVPDGNIDEVLDWVGDDSDRADRALAVELAAASPRSTLVARLESLGG